MARISIRTTLHIVPMIYVYTTPEIARHDGWSKIGYTEQGVDTRIEQQTHTVDVVLEELWRGNAILCASPKGYAHSEKKENHP